MERILNLPKSLGGTEIWYDDFEDKMVVNHVQDVEPLLEANKAEYLQDHGRYESDAVNKVASIPLVIVHQWMQEGLNIFDNSPETQKKLMQKLNSMEFRDLRTRPGKL